MPIPQRTSCEWFHCIANTDLEDCAAVGLSVLLVAAAKDGSEALVQRHLEVLAGIVALVVLGKGGAALVVLGLQEERREEPFLECQGCSEL